MSDPTRLTEIRARIFHGVPTTKDAAWLRDELAVVERERDTLRAALAESRPYVYSRATGGDPWRSETALDILKRVDAALASVSPEGEA